MMRARPSLIKLPRLGMLTGSPKPMYVIKTSFPMADGIVSAIRSIITDTR